MKKILSILGLLTLLASCTHKYTPVTSSMIDVTNYDIGNLNELKTGEACYKRIFIFPPINSSTSIIDAMKDGGISKIKMVDRSVYGGFFTYKECTIVHGL